MRVIEARNVNYAYKKATQMLRAHGEPSPSRDGNVVAMTEPVATVYYRPQERVIWSERRDANPFFHLLEARWMLQGRNDGRWLDQFVSNFSQRYGESKTGIMHGAYGHRWRRHFDVEGGGEIARLPDQLHTIVEMLRRDPTSRRAVLTMWDPVADLDSGHVDIPCNTHIYFRARTERGTPVLDMTVCCRSNDLVMGMCGANVVHMSVLLEYMASALGREIGTYTQISNNLHYYTRDKAKLPTDDEPVRCLYSTGEIEPTPLYFAGAEQSVFEFVHDLHMAWRNERGSLPSQHLAQAIEDVPLGDWREACREWIERRLAARRAREASVG